MKKLQLILAIFLATISGTFVNAATTQPLTDEYIAAIRTGCSDALQSLNQIQKTEAVTRVNRGQEYEGILRLVSALNSRIVLNKRDAPVLTSTTAKMQTTFNDFQRNYLDYAEKLDVALAINCNQAPVSFYDSLGEARDARALVATNVKTMNEQLDAYQAAFNEFRDGGTQ